MLGKHFCSHWLCRAPRWRLVLSVPRALQTWSAPSSSFAPGFPSQYSITHNRAYRDLAPKKKVLAGRTLCLPSASARHRLLSGPRTAGARRHPSEPDRPYVLLLRNVAAPVQHKAATCPTRTVSPAIAAHRAQRRTPSLEVISMRRLTPMSHAPLSAQSEVVICTCISRALAASPIARNPHSCCSRSKTTGDTPP